MVTVFMQESAEVARCSIRAHFSIDTRSLFFWGRCSEVFLVIRSCPGSDGETFSLTAHTYFVFVNAHYRDDRLRPGGDRLNHTRTRHVPLLAHDSTISVVK